MTIPPLQRLRQLATARPIVVAHRGDSRTYPENTLPAFAAAIRLGAPVIEFDVQATADGTLVCLHDEDLARTTDGAAPLQQTTLAELRHLDAGAWKAPRFAGTRVPTLHQALSLMLPQTLPMIEHKAGTPTQYLDLLRHLDCTADVLLQSFDWHFLAAIRALDANIALGLLGPHHQGERPDDTTFSTAAHLNLTFVHWHASTLQPADVERIHAAGLLCVSYTTDDEPGWQAGRNKGIDAMCTNVPGAMLAWRDGDPTR